VLPGPLVGPDSDADEGSIAHLNEGRGVRRPIPYVDMEIEEHHFEEEHLDGLRTKLTGDSDQGAAETGEPHAPITNQI
jgi:hypothetical protein